MIIVENQFQTDKQELIKRNLNNAIIQIIMKKTK